MEKCPVIEMKLTGEKISFIMLVQGYRVKDVQEYLGLLSPQAIYNWYRARNMPGVDSLYSLSK